MIVNCQRDRQFIPEFACKKEANAALKPVPPAAPAGAF
jgi:hypothetical protein